MSRQPFKPVRDARSKDRLQLVHSDVCGPVKTASLGGCRYIVTFIDDYSHCCAVFMLKHKSEVFNYFRSLNVRSIHTLRTDNGGEYLSTEFQDYLKSKGSRHELTILHTPQQNGVVERMNRTLVKMGRSMMAHANVSKSYWGEAIATAAYIHNRVPTTALNSGKTPYEIGYKRKPDDSHFRVFGCIA